MQQAILRCSALTKAYGRTLALDHIDLEVFSGRIVGLLGPNGSGKTTLIKLANGLLSPTAGEILIDGENILSPETDVLELRRRSQADGV